MHWNVIFQMPKGWRIIKGTGIWNTLVKGCLSIDLQLFNNLTTEQVWMYVLRCVFVIFTCGQWKEKITWFQYPVWNVAINISVWLSNKYVYVTITGQIRLAKVLTMVMDANWPSTEWGFSVAAVVVENRGTLPATCQSVSPSLFACLANIYWYILTMIWNEWDEIMQRNHLSFALIT